MQKKLTLKQECFVEQYLFDSNATQAAIRAGYSKRSAYQLGHKLLQKPHVREAVDAARYERQVCTRANHDYILGRLVDNVERAMEEQPVLDREGHQTGRYTWSGTVANRALELLGKYTGTFKLNEQGQPTTTIIVDTGVPGPPGSECCLDANPKPNKLTPRRVATEENH
jgi:phage terminase small subunit